MVRYLSLLSFTDQGVRNVKDTVKRAKAFHSQIEKAGGRLVSQYWAMGEADGAIIFEAPDDAAAAALLFRLGQLGNVRTRSMRVYDAGEIEKILAGL